MELDDLLGVDESIPPTTEHPEEVPPSEDVTQPPVEEAPVLDPEFGQGEPEGPLDPGFGQGEPIKPGDSLEDFLDGEDVIYQDTGTINKTEFKVPEELKSNYRPGCAGSNETLRRMMSNVTGYKITGTYFNLRTDRHDSNEPLSRNLSGSSQSYDMIQNTVLATSSALDSYKLEEATLEGILFIGIVPRVNDYFAFTDYNGKLLFFLVKEIERVNYSNREIHRVTLNYSFSETTGKDKIQDLMSKIVDRLVYDHSANILGESGILSSADYQAKLDLHAEVKRMKSYYLQQFLSEDGIINLYAKKRVVGVETIPALLFYDPLVYKFFESLFDFSDERDLMDLYEPKYKMRNDYIDIFKALRERVSVDVKDLHRYYSVGRNDIHGFDPYLEDILSVTRDAKVLVQYKGKTDMAKYPEHEMLMYRNNEELDLLYPLLGKKPDDFSYIFSSSFYDGKVADMNGFEKIVYKVLNKQYPSVLELAPYISTYRKWSIYEQFYILPILIYISRKVIKTMKSM